MVTLPALTSLFGGSKRGSLVSDSREYCVCVIITHKTNQTGIRLKREPATQMCQNFSYRHPTFPSLMKQSTLIIHLCMKREQQSVWNSLFGRLILCELVQQ